MKVDKSAIEGLFNLELYNIIGADLDLKSYIIDHCLHVIPMLDRISELFEEYTDHGAFHSYRVAQLADELTPGIRLNMWEAAVFLLSAFYHDVGMCCTPDELDAIENTPHFNRQEPLFRDIVVPRELKDNTEEEVVRKYVLIEYLRREHTIRSKKKIIEMYPHDNENSYFNKYCYFWELVANCSRGHGLSHKAILSNDNYSHSRILFGKESVDLIFLTTLLRLADICHMSRDRALPYLRRTMEFYSSASQKKWKKAGDIAGVKPLAGENKIQVQADCRDANSHGAVMQSANRIQNELVRCHRTLTEKRSKRTFPWRFIDTSMVKEASGAGYIYTGDRFKMNFDKVSRLLMGQKLYEDELDFIRECIQNGLDATSVFKLHDPEEQPYVVVYYCTENNQPILRVFDNGTGMSRKICSEHLLSIGSESFWFSEKRYEDWPGEIQKTSVIASHGIGFLSTFMLADVVEVYSQYWSKRRFKQPVHMRVESLSNDVVYLCTKLEEFPIWGDTDLPIRTPWKLGHGTCIQLRLSKSLERHTLLQYLRENIVRPHARFFVVYENHWIEFPNLWRNWYFRKTSQEDTWDELLEKLKLSTIDEEEQEQSKAFSMEGINGYFPMPGDREWHGEGNLHISQNGVLVRNVRDSLFSKIWYGGGDADGRWPIRNLLLDIDITGEHCMELDAERVSFTWSESNEARRCGVARVLAHQIIAHISEMKFNQVVPTTNPLAMNAYDVRKDEPDVKRCMDIHSWLYKAFPAMWLQLVEGDEDCFTSLFDIPLYGLIKDGEIQPVTANYIRHRASDFRLVLPIRYSINKLEKVGFKKVGKLVNRMDQAQNNALNTLSKSTKLILIPGYPRSFTLPLLSVCSIAFDSTLEDDLLLTFIIREKNPPSSPDKLIETELINFCDNKTNYEAVIERYQS